MDDSTLTKLILSVLSEIPDWEWHDDDETPYADGETGLFYGAIGPTPDRAVGARVYGGTDDPETGLKIRRVQLRTRGEPGRKDGADVLADAAFARLKKLSRVGGILGIRRESMTPLGADTNGREERSDNYAVTVDNVEATA
ncbi:minor capsid protein [uncultured Microbacterium sp.]|uniref:minor capsid protein n=1 Tax=uncultured Microbacterium sp. TaxID=191216 RepID=UPI0025FC9490|nr:minor capsid protein [uncultured Microbacterium sp.]